jgi:hypothetical protein
VLSRSYATRITREWNVPHGGVGYVTRFDVRRQYLDRYRVRQAGGQDAQEYWIPAGELAGFNANIVGAISEVARYRGPVTGQEFTQAARGIGHPAPPAWRDYLQGPSWFARGWLPSGRFLSLYAPGESLDAAHAWELDTVAFPGLMIIGTDGSRELIVIDARRDPAPVLLVDITSENWDDARPQAADVGQFIERVEAGTFEITWLPRGGRRAANRCRSRVPRGRYCRRNAGCHLERELRQAAGAAAAAVAGRAPARRRVPAGDQGRRPGVHGSARR